MGIPKQSRKGKKAWRKNIDASEIETFLESEGHKQQREPAVESLKDEELFVVDKAADDAAVPAAVSRGKKDPKPLRSQLILDGLRDGITPVPQGTKRKAKGAGKPLPNSTAAAAAAGGQQQQQQAVVVTPPSKKQRRRKGTAVSLTDIWADELLQQQKEQDWTTHKSGNELDRLAKLKQQQQQQLADTAATSRGKSRKRPAPAPIPAVEVDLPGCSFNPEYEAHQDALAVAVAAEYKKQLKQELAPSAPSLFAPAGYKPGDELDELLADAEADEEEQQQQQQQQLAQAAAAAAAKDENAIAIDDDDADAGAENNTTGVDNDVSDKDGLEFTVGKSPAAAAAASRKTRKDRNKEARRKQQEAEADAKRQLKRQRQQLEALQQLQQQLEAEAADKEALRKRREVVKQEKAAIQPPRLGKHKFEAPAPEVLTSDQVTGSLRQLQPCFLVTEDRFKALQKRGLIEPRKAAGKKQGRKVEYVTGERREKAEARQNEVREMAAARKKAAKGGAAGAAALAALAGQGGKSPGKKGGKKQDGAAAAPAHQMSLAVGGDVDTDW